MAELKHSIRHHRMGFVVHNSSSNCSSIEPFINLFSPIHNSTTQNDWSALPSLCTPMNCIANDASLCYGEWCGGMRAFHFTTVKPFVAVCRISNDLRRFPICGSLLQHLELLKINSSKMSTLFERNNSFDFTFVLIEVPVIRLHWLIRLKTQAAFFDWQSLNVWRRYW